MRRNLLSLLALTLLAACARGAAVRPAVSSADEREVLAVVDRLFATMRSKDTAAMRTLFEPSARLVGMRTRPTGEQVLQVLTADRFIAFVATDRREWIERAWRPEVRVRGTLASVWAEYDFHFGSAPSHCGVDAVHLIRTSAGWRITDIADTFETTGCPTRPAPAAGAGSR